MIHLPKPWRLPLVLLGLGWAGLAGLYFATGAAMVEIWNRSETFAHAWVVPPISAWLVWRMRAELAVLSPAPASRWLLALLPLGLLWLVGEIAAANAATQFALMGMAVILVPVMLGPAVAARLAFPLGFLFFAVPFGDFLTPWLVDRTADFTVVAVRASGIPVFREGNEFIIPSGSWSVVQACSGIRYLMASLMVGTLFAYLNFRSNRKRWAFVAVAIVTPLVANWLRAYMIVMLGHLSGNRLAVGVDHIIYGWVFFGAIMLAMFMIGSRWADADHEAPLITKHALAPVPLGTRGVLVFTIALLLVALPPVLRSQIEGSGTPGVAELRVPVAPGWVWVAEPLTTWSPHFENPAAELHGRLEPKNGGPAIGLYVAYYRGQRPGHKLVTSVNGLISGSEEQEWSVTTRGSEDLLHMPWRTADLRGQGLARVVNGSGDSPRLRVWQTYWINGCPIVRDWQAKLYGVWMSLTGRGDDAAAVLFYVDKTQAGVEDSVLKGAIEQHWPNVEVMLREARDRKAPPQQ